MKKALLASTALVGAALLTAPAQAGTVGSGDNLAVNLKGLIFFQASFLDEDQSAGFGRGYRMNIPEAEITIQASNTADNGIKYGVEIEMEVNTDAGNNADEAWAFFSGDFGRVELGDQDDASSRMIVGAHNATKGTASTSGGLTSHDSIFHSSTKTAEDRFISRTDVQAFLTGDATKIIYFTPRISGFQGGASFTPDVGSNGADFGETDNGGDYENALGLGLNYVGKFDDVGFSAAITYATAEDDGNGTVKEDMEVLAIGAKVDIAGFTVGANWHDMNETNLTIAEAAAGEDAGTFWAVAAGYSMGPWGVGAWYSDGERDASATTEVSLTRWGIGGKYAVAPGWTVFVDYVQNEHENIEGTAGSNNGSRGFAITQLFTF